MTTLPKVLIDEISTNLVYIHSFHSRPQPKAGDSEELYVDLLTNEAIRKRTPGSLLKEGRDDIGSEQLSDQSGIVGGYYPMNGEVDIRELFSHLKHLAFSRVDIKNPDSPIEFIDVGQFDLKKNYRPNSECLIESKSICVPSIIIVPAIAFDQNFNRIGYGKGHFDKFLHKVSEIGYKPYKIGVCFDFQLLETVPDEPHDVQMDAIVTETRILRRI